MSEKPDDFDAHWDGIDRELARQPMHPVLELMPRHSSEHFDVYTVRMTSSGPYRIFGFFSVPKGVGPFPGLLEVPRYGSVNNIADWNDRCRYAVLTIMHRGQRLADRPFAAAYPGLLTLGIDDVNGYVYNGIVADCLRGAEFLLARDEVDSDRVALRGNDLALLTAARRGGFKAVHVEGLFLYRAMEARGHVDAYPLEELNDHLRTSPGSEEAMARTLAMFDPIHHAPAVAATVAMGIGDVEWVDDRAWLEPLLEAVGGGVEEQLLTYRGAVDHDGFDAWLAGQLGVEPMSPFRTVAL